MTRITAIKVRELAFTTFYFQESPSGVKNFTLLSDDFEIAFSVEAVIRFPHVITAVVIEDPTPLLLCEI